MSAKEEEEAKPATQKETPDENNNKDAAADADEDDQSTINSHSNDLVIRDGFPALLKIIQPQEENSTKSKKTTKEWWIDETDETMTLPKFPFWSHSKALVFPHHKDTDALQSLLLDDCTTVFTARTKDDDAAYSAGTTFFLPAEMKPRCALEALVKSIFEKHVHKNVSDGMYKTEQSGAEWWTLVLGDNKEGAGAAAADDDGKKNGKGKESAAEEEEEDDNEDNEDEVGWHFDADYGLEEQAPGLLLHPRLATVTYLSDYGAPTVVVDCKTPEQGKVQHMEGQEINKAWVSYPKIGKHIAFDGRLLHGAPAHVFPGLQCCNDKEESDNMKSKQSTNAAATTTYEPPAKRAKKDNNGTDTSGHHKSHQNQRITLLVNIWLNHCPLDAELLDDEILEQLKTPWSSNHNNNNNNNNNNDDGNTTTSNSSIFHWSDGVDTSRQEPPLHKAKLQRIKKKQDGTTIEDEVVLCNHHVTVQYGATAENYQEVTQLASASEDDGMDTLLLELGTGKLKLSVGDPVSSDSEADEEEEE